MNLALQAKPPAAPLSLRVNFQWTFVGNMVNALGQWAVLMLLAWFTSPADVGKFGLGLFISAPVMAVVMLQLRSVQVTDARAEFPFCDYFGTRVLWTLAGVAVIAAWAVVGYDSMTAWVIVLVGVAKAIDSLSDIVRGVFQRHERMDYNGISLILRGIAAVAAAAIVWRTGNVVAAAAAVAGAYLICFVGYDLVWAKSLLRLAENSVENRRLRPRFRWTSIARLTWIALPLGIVMGLISLQMNIPRLALEPFWDLAALGSFAAIVYPMQTGQMVLGALGQSAAPRLSRYYLENVPAYRRLLRKLLLVAGGLGVAAVVITMVVGKPLLHALYGADYAGYHREFVVLAIAAAIQLISSCWGFALTSARRFRSQVILVAISCTATAAAAFLLVPRFGVMGASLTVLVTSIVMGTMFLIAMKAAIRGGGPKNGSGIGESLGPGNEPI